MTLELLTQIFEVCIVPLLGILTKFLVDYLSAKCDEAKANTDSALAQVYLDMIYDTVSNCVIATNQTYVDSLKGANAFTADAQKEAFDKTLNAVMSILTEDAKDYLALVTDDVTTYLTQLIEAEVNKHK